MVVHTAHHMRRSLFDDIGLRQEKQKECFLGMANANWLVGLVEDKDLAIERQYLGIERQYLTRSVAVVNGALVCYLCTEELLPP